MANIVVEPLALAGLKCLRPRRFSDIRGSFMEVYRRDAYQAAGIAVEFVQDNLASSLRAGTVRGLHFQAPPQSQAKLIHVLSGAIFDVAVDIRFDSPSYGEWCSTTLTAEGGEQLFVPAGFAHGYCTLADDTVVAYKVDRYHAPDLEGGIQWNDPAIGITWPVAAEEAVMSERDRSLPPLAGFVSPFRLEAPGTA